MATIVPRGYSHTTVVLLQKNPSHDLLIGTDLLPLMVEMFRHKKSKKAKEKIREPPKQDMVNSPLE